ncbi:HmuY family protein [Tenacibaculum jejuense]|uniref:Probable lipoprotein n=1 Tax=Tenacibaculum jejuense TaxID=584609 RepID=A0A238UCU6_9FLAO|nr:HmuY family protein [Tenacibaculum jejuense]SNR16210.1 Probable lipoprotein precursor [Tenacibaculum jejuense]
MKQIKLILTLLVIGFVVTSCNDEDNTIPAQPVESKTITNLAALQDTDFTQNPPVTTGSFTKFSFKAGTVVTDDNWDIAFRGTTILVNGGTKIGSLSDEPERTGNAALVIQSGTFANVTTAPDGAEFSQDASGSYALPTGSDNGWYNYAGPPTHLISPLAGKVIIVRTKDGNYAKMEILNYYKDNDPTEADNARYYSFNYVYNPNVGDKSIQ